MPPNSGNYNLLDVHGAGAQRSDPKTGDPDNYPYGHGPQGDVIRIYNYVRLVRNTENTTGTREGHSDASSAPREFKLGQNYPNPFNPSTTISFELPGASQISLKIHNSAGQHVATLLEDDLTAGNYQFQWNSQNLPSGIYYYTLKSRSFSQTKRMILLK